MIVGDGIIILMVVWLVCIVLALVLSREPGPMKAAGFGMIVIAAVITIILFRVPRGVPLQLDAANIVTKFEDYSTWRSLIIAMSVLFTLGGAGCWFLAHFVQPVYAPS